MNPGAPPRILLLNKPFGVLCQFTDARGRPTLKDFVPIADVYAAGRLDADSEGLVVLTDSGRLQHRITDPRHDLCKTYWVQVEQEPNEGTLERLRRGVPLKDGLTLPAEVRRIDEPGLWPRVPPVRFRKNVPTAWLEMILSEGRNRQARRMTAAVGHATLRLVRVRVGPWHIGDMGPGIWREAEVPRNWLLPGAGP